MTLGDVFIVSISGAVGGAGLGLALRGWRRMIGLALAGAIGLGIGGMIIGEPYSLVGWVPMGIIGGAFLGAALGYLECRRADRDVE